jgi:hypothetical protein
VLVYAASLERLDNAANVQHGVVDLADLEDMPAAGNDVADVEDIALVRQVADRLASLVEELVPEGLGLALHAHHSIATA